jgi:uncharacterized protein YbjQ (UPF0145 family)
VAEFLIQAGILIVVYFIGTQWKEKRHYKSIKKREAALQNIPVYSISKLDFSNSNEFHIVAGSVAISSDAFKRFVAKIISIFGGRITVFESLIDRARREAMLRMQEKAATWGAHGIVNVRIETSSISKNTQNSNGIVEILVYGTAIK